MQDVQRESSEAAAENVAYWSSVRRVTAALLVIWLLATVVGPWFARDLATVRWFGFPLSFWAASQGALLVYLAIIVIYALVMDRLEAPQRTGGAGAPAARADAAAEGRDE